MVSESGPFWVGAGGNKVDVQSALRRGVVGVCVFVFESGWLGDSGSMFGLGRLPWMCMLGGQIWWVKFAGTGRPWPFNG